jgi:2-polyprenyl-6-methoxyphenol hydroxylase-like FAD-dependent oxidoreductase
MGIPFPCYRTSLILFCSSSKEITVEKVTPPIEVLIVGAGPPGLMMACQLAMRNISFRIIDKSEQHIEGSGALIIHSRSLEILNQMGIADKAISEGILASKINVVFNGKKPLTLVLNKMGKGETKFPGLLLIEQSKTEQLLTDFLHSYGYKVERKSELTDFSQYDDGCTNIVRMPDGNNIAIKSKYLIAADGSQSFIRNQLKIPFSGQTYKLSLFVLDGKADIDLPPDEICFSFTDKSSTGIFPLKGGRWRIDGTIPRNISAKEKIVFADVEPGFASRNRLKIKLHEPERFSVFHSHQQYAGAFKYKRCFMIGDAAHVFSPVGAQGMNTGMQDAYNLAWKLTMVLKGYSNDSLLNSYQKERQPLARNMIKTTDHLFRMVTSNEKTDKKIRLQLAPYLLKFLFPILEKQKIISHYVFNGISEISINYRNSPLSAIGFSRIFSLQAPRPGDRLPCFSFLLGGNKLNLQDLVNEGLFHLIILSGNSNPEKFKMFTGLYTGWLSVLFIPLDGGTRPLYKRLGIKKNGCYLVRPDMYIAYRAKKIIKKDLVNYLTQLSVVTPAIKPG